MEHAAGGADFNATYDRLILGKEFVEFRDYYMWSRRRYKQTVGVIGGLGLQPGARHLDVGGGQMALMTSALFGFAGSAGDVVTRASDDVKSQGLSFERFNLMDDIYSVSSPFDLVTLLEVIEHLPVPPYIVLRKLRSILKPGGWLVMTTPNGMRLRNILRMLANREVLDIYRLPDGDEPLGHQHEYTLRQMDWQLREAGLEPVVLKHYASGWRGASNVARIAHAVTSPVNLVPHLRDGLMIAARRDPE